MVLWATTFTAWADESCLLQATPAIQELQLEVVTPDQATACPRGTTDFSYNWTGLGNIPAKYPSGGALSPIVEIAPNLKLVEFASNTRCIGAAIWTFGLNDNESAGKDEDLWTCPDNQKFPPHCNMLVAQQADSPTPDVVNDCAPLDKDGEEGFAKISLRFTTPTTLIALNYWDIEKKNELIITLGSESFQSVKGGNKKGSEQYFNKAQVTDWSLTFKGSGGVHGIRYCRPVATDPEPPAGVEGDPHVRTLDGNHYLLLNQGSFSLWRFSGPQAQFWTSKGSLKKAQVDWQIYTHYSGQQSFTKGLLLVDQSAQTFRRALEITSKDCVWRTRTEGDDWDVVQEPQLLSATVGTGFNITSHHHVRLYMNTKDGHREVAVLSYSCRPSHHINLAIQMRRPGDVKFVQGELRAARKAGETSMLEMTDEEFQEQKSWMALGGSSTASMYLEAMDEPVSSNNFVRKCQESQKADAAKICSKHLGEKMQEEGANTDFFSDCVFDVCMGAGEVAAELAAELLASTRDV